MSDEKETKPTRDATETQPKEQKPPGKPADPKPEDLSWVKRGF